VSTVPSSHDQGSQTRIGRWDSPKTREVSRRLIELGRRTHDERVESMGERMHECATSDLGWTCGGPLCPRCRARRAKKNRRGLERILRRVGEDTRLAVFTATAPSHRILTGRSNLLATYTEVRRQKLWKQSVIGGIGQIEVIPSSGRGTRKWHVHQHSLVWLRAGAIDSRSICASWRRRQDGSSAHWLPLNWRWADAARTFRAGRVLLHEAARVRLDRMHRRGATRGRPDGTGQALGTSLRPSGGGV
jgi:hypothetical protein